MEENDTKVSWLGEGFPLPPGVTRQNQLKDFLIDVNVLEKEGDQTTWAKTPPSLQVISSGGTSMAKWWAGLTAAGVGGSALVQGLKALGWLPGSEEVQGVQQQVLTASAALMASTAVIAVAIIVKADVSARAAASAAEYTSRAVITRALVEGFRYEAPPPTSAAPAPQHVVRTTEGEWFPVRQFEWRDGGLVARVDDHRLIRSDKIEWITPTGVWNDRA